MKTWFPIPAFICVIMSSCGSADSTKNKATDAASIDSRKALLLSQISANQEVWKSKMLRNYAFLYVESMPDCPQADSLPPVTVTVRENEVVTVHSDYGYDGDPRFWPSIDSIFLNLQSKVEADSLVVLNSSMIDFDSDFGFARDAFFDFSESECDGYTVSVQNLIAL